MDTNINQGVGLNERNDIHEQKIQTSFFYLFWANFIVWIVGNDPFVLMLIGPIAVVLLCIAMIRFYQAVTMNKASESVVNDTVPLSSDKKSLMFFGFSILILFVGMIEWWVMLHHYQLTREIDVFHVGSLMLGSLFACIGLRKSSNGFKNQHFIFTILLLVFIFAIKFFYQFYRS